MPIKVVDLRKIARQPGDGPMVMLGHHARPTEEMKTILYETRKELVREGRENGPRPRPTSTKILV